MKVLFIGAYPIAQFKNKYLYYLSTFKFVSCITLESLEVIKKLSKCSKKIEKNIIYVKFNACSRKNKIKNI